MKHKNMHENSSEFDLPLTSFIDGVSRESESSALIDVIDPSCGERLLSVPKGSQADVECAVASSRHSFETGDWCDAPPSLKKKTLIELADLIEAQAGTFDRLDAEEMGKPVRLEAFNAIGAAGLLRYYGECVDKFTGEVHGGDKRTMVLQRRVPRGVVAAITPWNFPIYNAVLKVGPALAAGNSVVLKPSELSSRSAILLAHLALKAGLPKGALNLVLGAGETVGQALAMHRDLDMITFTGSTAVGRQVARSAGSNLKTVMAECGGKSPHILFDDGVDLDAAASSIAGGLLTNQGQICSVGSRLLVERSIAKQVVDRIVGRLADIRIGDALDPDTTFGPLASARQCEKVLGLIQSARAAGLDRAVGGRRVAGRSAGYFVEPTVFTDVPPDAEIAQEEIFGPVLAVIPFNDESEAVRIANGTAYGLAAYVWTASLSRGLRMAKAIRSSVFINAAAPASEGAGHAASYEPTGASGLGVEGGLAGVESYTRRQLAWFSHD